MVLSTYAVVVSGGDNTIERFGHVSTIVGGHRNLTDHIGTTVIGTIDGVTTANDQVLLP